MAGLFGLFNFEKEGPGIAKDAPKKKTFIVFFETFFRNFWKFIPLNIVYTIMSLPLITSGLANAGITNIARNTARDKHSFGMSDFFETIKKNWKQALPAGIINTIIYILLIAVAAIYFISVDGFMGSLGLGVMLSALLVFTMMNMYMWTLMITFKFKLGQIYKNSFRFAFISLFKNFGCLLCLASVYAAMAGLLVLAFYKLPAEAFVYLATLEAILYTIFYPSFKFLLIQYFIFPSVKKHIIDPYYAEHPDEDIERRKDLGLEVEEDDDDDDDDDDEELVFYD